MHAILIACDRGMGSRPLIEACERDLANSIAIVVTVNADIPTPQLSVTGGDNRSDQSRLAASPSPVPMAFASYNFPVISDVVIPCVCGTAPSLERALLTNIYKD